MKTDTNGAGVGIAIVVGFLIIVGLIHLATPECRMSGCDFDAQEGSRYCYAHDTSHRTYSYSNQDDDEYENRKENRSSTSSSSSSSSYSTSSTAKNTYSNTSSTGTSRKKKSASSSKKVSNPYESYDDGYEDVYDGDDYDWDRYNSDPDYADGVDDAMEDCEDW